MSLCLYDVNNSLNRCQCRVAISVNRLCLVIAAVKSDFRSRSRRDIHCHVTKYANRHKENFKSLEFQSKKYDECG